ncbi:glycerophosphodiester phosphodiesterase family protein [Rhodobium gokarnense]|uniref:Glycerophosphoryl diester phosphodiesterase n=1 Tax=Rhodobium gokarnense TaxID=364296 RepID=A0ABT3HA48_9HYPH|nr:glycerophosphodiester phosphodiesterase family protein [Rhodobium gokarnense]MCW2307263.1 glycerophosphoryl diester phosphodiesterase [Rhodobium gokarnense]
MTAPAWLTARPVAHRGYHDAHAGRIENSLAAAAAAIGKGFSIEADLQLSADGVPMVFHDDTLDRLTEGRGPVGALTAAELSSIPLMDGGGDTIPTLKAFLDLVGGRVPLVLEMKSDMRRGAAIAGPVADVLAGYDGPVAVMSFDPEIVAAFKTLAPHLPRGITACATSPRDPEWRLLTLMERFALRHLLHAPRTRLDFIAYDIDALPAPAVSLMHRLFGTPVLTWTVRTTDQRRRAARHADQIIFEGFDPDA